MRRSLLPTLLFSLAVAGCGPRWNVVAQANPNPLRGVNTFALDGVHFEMLRVGAKTEADYLAGKSADQQASFQADKVQFQEKYSQSVVGEAAMQFTQFPPKEQNTFAVVTYITYFEPGFYVGVAHGDTEVEVDVKITTASGQLVDEFTARSRIAATMTSPSSGDRLRKAGDDLGVVVAKYLKSRTTGS
ncbi:MAG: hypothetical protein ACXVEF_43100 [Polyangiales bacterium]